MDWVYLTSEEINQFWKLVDICERDECWKWQGDKNKKGYGVFTINNGQNWLPAPKISFMIAHNFGIAEIPNSIVIRHTCNNPTCVNPHHLLLGTHKDNAQDRLKAGGYDCVRGENNCKAKLTQDQVKDIRAKWDTGKYTKHKLANDYGVTTGEIWRIVLNKTWHDPEYEIKYFDHVHKFSNDVVKNIMKDRQNGVATKDILAKYKVSQSQFYNIINGRQRKEAIGNVG